MRILISGYYGYGNAGDEAVLQALLSLLRDTWPAAEPVVLSANVDDTQSRHGVTAVSRWRPDAFAREALRADLFLSGGGTLFQDATSARSLAFYLGQLELARWIGIPRAVAFQGLGPLRRPVSRTLLTPVLQETSALVFRDHASAALSQDLGIVAPPTIVAADPAVLIAPVEDSRINEILRTADLPARRPILLVSLRDFPGAEAVGGAVAAALRETLSRCDLELAMAPLHASDREVCRRVQTEIGSACRVIEEPLAPGEWVGLLTRCHAVLGMRLHSLIFAAAAGIPAAGLSYDPKVSAFIRESGQVLAGDTEGLTVDAVIAALDRLIAEHGSLTATAIEARRAMSARIREAMRWLADLLS